MHISGPMLVAIHQPNLLPWCGYFCKMARADTFVLYDDVQFTKGGYINRCSIKTARGAEWLTIPVVTAGRLYQGINEVTFSPGPWRKRLLGKIQENYKNAPYFKRYFGQIQEIAAREYEFLAELNISLLEWLRQELCIDTPLVRSSQLAPINGASTERLVSICKSLGATAYLFGAGARNYQEEEPFRQAGIDLQSNQFEHPVYTQLWDGFVPKLSIIDLLFNTGPEAANLIGSARTGISL